MMFTDRNSAGFHCPFPQCDKIYRGIHSLKHHLMTIRTKGGDAKHSANDSVWDQPQTEILLQKTSRRRNVSQQDRRKQWRERSMRRYIANKAMILARRNACPVNNPP